MAQYCATSDITDYVDFDSDATVDNNLISDLITRASKIIDNHCGRNFDAAVAVPLVSSDCTTRLFDAVRDAEGLMLWLDHDLAGAVTITNGDGVAVTTDQYVLLPTNEPPYYAVKLKASSGVAWTYTSDPEEAISIVGHWSYNTTSDNIADITWACVRLVHWLYKQRESSADLDRPLMVEGSGTVIMPTRLPADVLSVLEPYRRMKVWAA
jgi:hypothetical protein